MPADDIPEAVRESYEEPETSPPKKRRWLVWRLVGLGAIALVASIGLHFQWELSLLKTTFGLEKEKVAVEAVELSPSPSPSPSPTPDTVAKEVPENLLGHLPYEQAPLYDLKPVIGNGNVKLRSAAAAKFNAMSDAAWRDGIELVPLSGFRNIEDQRYLFFEVKAQRGQVAVKRAEVSAPPGYSEHHTGYAIDIGDVRRPETDLSESFEETETFKWLQANAAYYSFELSFPRDNPQGISYEPWHWRFVGDRHSLETFYKAQNLK
ncbi:MAG: D-alanyl-D-alanine carboxypeptidase family protein [Okeania sp. SIO2H7]|nr:D-alanyl-D-alanine carboxypeptidase family protein [Okeania sp. SIO2H7]